MSELLRRLRLLFARAQLALWLLVLAGCGHMNERVLSPLGGDAFTLFPAERQVQRPACTGTEAERFECFAKEFQTRSAERGISAILATVNAQGEVRTVVSDTVISNTVISNTVVSDTAGSGSISESTAFPLASVSKMIVGATAVALAADGRLSLKEPIAKYLPELDAPSGSGQANLSQLLSHSAGLGDPPLCEPGSDQVAEIVKRYGNQPLLAPPGAVYSYSTLGYVLAVAVIERVTQQSFAALSTERVLGPAGLSHPRFGPESVSGEVGSRSCGAVWSSGVVLDIREFAHWVDALARLDQSPLGRSLVEELTEPRIKTAGAHEEAYGYGVGRVEHGGLTVFSHSGRIGDYTSFAGWSPARRLSVVAFAHSPEPFPSGAGVRALSTFLDLPVDWSDSTPSRPLESYAGQYVDAVGTLGQLDVAVEDGHLVIDYPKGAPSLRPPEFRFFFDGSSERAVYVATAVGFGKRAQ